MAKTQNNVEKTRIFSQNTTFLKKIKKYLIKDLFCLFNF